MEGLCSAAGDLGVLFWAKGSTGPRGFPGEGSVAGALSDAGARMDPGALTDLGDFVDFGAFLDSGALLEAGPLPDLGALIDFGAFFDSGAPFPDFRVDFGARATNGSTGAVGSRKTGISAVFGGFLWSAAFEGRGGSGASLIGSMISG